MLKRNPKISPTIFPVESAELHECLHVIHQSFATVAKEFLLTQENCPKHTSFLPMSHLRAHMSLRWQMFGLHDGERIVGYMSVSNNGDGSYSLHNLAVLPKYRHAGYGTLLLTYAKRLVKCHGGRCLKVSFVEESTVLRKWYEKNGFIHIGAHKFDHLPFTSGYLEWRVGVEDLGVYSRKKTEPLI